MDNFGDLREIPGAEVGVCQGVVGDWLGFAVWGQWRPFGRFLEMG